MAYGIAKKGTDWLKRERATLFSRSAKSKKSFGRLFLEHGLLVSEIIVVFELACRQRRGIRFLWPTNSQGGAPSHWSVTLNRRLKCKVAPDAVFGLEYAGRTCWYFVEADRGTMPVTRRSLEKSSLRRKFECYAATWEQKTSERFGVHRFRVLTVTNKSDRAENMIDVCRDNVKAGTGLFLFTTLATLRKQPDFWTLPWQTVYSKEPVLLLN